MITAHIVLLLGLLACFGRAEQRLTNRWAVEVRGGPEAADTLARKYGFENRGQVRSLHYSTGRYLPFSDLSYRHNNTLPILVLGRESEGHLPLCTSWTQNLRQEHHDSPIVPVDRSHTTRTKCETLEQFTTSTIGAWLRTKQHNSCTVDWLLKSPC